jgi:NTE family protein
MRVHTRWAGGGVNLLEYAGALEALEAAGIEVASAAGTSAGAIMAGALGSGLRSKDIQKLLLDFAPMSKTIVDIPWWNIPGLISGRGMVQGVKLQKALDDQFVSSFGECVIPTACFTTNLSKGAVHEWSSQKTIGVNLAEAVTASCRIPVVFAHYVSKQKEIHVDGGVVYNYPIDFKFEGQNEKLPTIGFMFRSTDGGPQPNLIKGSALDEVMASMNNALAAISREHMEDANFAKTCVLLGGKALDFDLDRTAVRKAFTRGKDACSKWLEENPLE